MLFYNEEKESQTLKEVINVNMHFIQEKVSVKFTSHRTFE
jgi:hypothetical protein